MKVVISPQWTMAKALEESRAMSEMPAPTHVCLTKTADKGTIANHAIFEGYQVWGHCERLPVVGERFQVWRYRRNDVELMGLMTTTEVTTTAWQLVEDHPMRLLFETANSSYRLDFLPDEPMANHE